MRRAAKVDANQAEIVAALRAVGASVQPLHAVGSGVEMDEVKMWKCLECGLEKRATVHQERQKYCSRECVSSAYKRRMAGPNNPNYRAAGEKRCKQCGETFVDYVKTRKFCSSTCYHASRPKRQPKPVSPGKIKVKKPAYVKKGRPPSKLVISECLSCGLQFSHYPSAKRKYCSYKCHLESGGAQRAGDASRRARMKYGPKKDANHKEVMEAIRTITAVHDLSNAGFGIPDGIAWINDGWHLFDIKNPKTGYGRRGLNKRQQSWASDWRGGPVYLIYTVEEAIQFARGKFDGLKRFPDDNT